MNKGQQLDRRTVLKALGAGPAVLAGLGASADEAGGDDFTMVFITDTHVDMKCSVENLRAISDWIAENADGLNIRFVGHQGDVGDRRGSGSIGEMLTVCREALQPVLDARVPLSVAIGNHDYDSGSDSRPCTAFNDRTAFGAGFYEGQPGFGGSFEAEAVEAGRDPGGTVNHYFTLEAGGRKFLFLTLELYPRDKVMAWADGLVRNRLADHEIIVNTHAYLHRQGHLTAGVSYDGFSREDGPEYSNDGAEMWERYFQHWSNLRLVTGGHFIDEPRQAYLAQTGAHGNLVHTHFWNYQNWGYRDGELYNTRREGDFQAAMIKMFRVHPAGDAVLIENFIPPAGVEGEPADPDRHDAWG